MSQAKTKIRLGTIGVNENNAKFIDFILKLAGAQLQYHWQLAVEEPSAQVMLVDMEDAGGQAYWKARQANGDGEQILIAFSWQSPRHCAWFLEKPFSRIQPLLDILNRVPEVMNNKSDFGSEPPSTPGNGGDDYFVPEGYFCCLLREMASGCQNYRLEIEGLAPIYVQGTTGRCFSSYSRNAEEIQQVSAQGREQIQYSVISEEILNLATQGLHDYPLALLLWLNVLHFSRGRSQLGITPFTPLRLTGWPNFTSLPYSPEHMMLSAHLTRHVTTAEQAAGQLKLPLARVMDFINACAVLELLELNPAPKPAKPAPTKPARSESRIGRGQSLLGGLLRRLLPRHATTHAMA